MNNIENIIELLNKNEHPHNLIIKANDNARCHLVGFLVLSAYLGNKNSNLIITTDNYYDLGDIASRYLSTANIDHQVTEDQIKIIDGGITRLAPLWGAFTGFEAGDYRAPGFSGAIIIDECNENSYPEREHAIDIYKHSLKSRRNNYNPDTPIIIIQDKTDGPIASYVKEYEKEDWRIL